MRKERELGARMAGQMTFESGWEWTYWFQNIVTARAQWDPVPALDDDREAFIALVTRILRPFGDAAGPLATWFADYSEEQLSLLINGEVDGQPPADIEKLNGIAYLEGWDTFADIGSFFESFLKTQPDRVNHLDFRRSEPVTPDYATQVSPLLVAMRDRFGALNGQLDAIAPLVAPVAAGYFREIEQAAEALALRASFLKNTYDFASTHEDGPTSQRRAWLKAAETDMAAVETIVRSRELSYRTPLLRVAGWRPNPTVYQYAYIWQVKSMYYYHRDLDKAQALSLAAYSPCYMNVIDPAIVAFGEGQLHDLLEKIREWADERKPGSHFVIDCLTAPLEEPTYPLARA